MCGCVCNIFWPAGAAAHPSSLNTPTTPKNPQKKRNNKKTQPQGKCTKFPVVIGETGSAYETAVDKQWLKDFADFINARGDARDYNDVPVNGWLWWAWNENSGDTGGIVHNMWQDFSWEKINFHIEHLGLRPWFLRE